MNADDPRQRGWDDGYSVGYADGESSGYADFYNALVEILPDGVEPYPTQVADYIRRLQRAAEKAS